jgi:hypothetical protein
LIAYPGTEGRAAGSAPALNQLWRTALAAHYRTGANTIRRAWPERPETIPSARDHER